MKTGKKFAILALWISVYGIFYFVVQAQAGIVGFWPERNLVSNVNTPLANGNVGAFSPNTRTFTTFGEVLNGSPDAITPNTLMFANLAAQGRIRLISTEQDAPASHAKIRGILNVTDAEYGAKGDGITENSTAFRNAVAGAGASGSIYLPPGTYTWTNPAAFALTKANCNVTIEGDAQGGTILKPNFSNADAVSYIDSASKNPGFCRGGLRNIYFIAPSSVPTNLNLVHISNLLSVTIENVTAYGFRGARDATIDIDPGVGPGGTTWTEQTRIINLNSFYSTYMLVLDGKSESGTSLNNTTLIASSCHTAGTGACVYYKNFANGGIALNSLLEFNGDVLNSGASVIRSSGSASYANAVEYHVRMQYVPGTGSGNCFDAPSGSWSVAGYVTCVGRFTGSTNSVPVSYSMVATNNNGPTPLSFLQNGSGAMLMLVDPTANGEFLSFDNSTGTAPYWSVNVGFFSGSQGNLAIEDNVSRQFPLSISPKDVVNIPNGVATNKLASAPASAIGAGHCQLYTVPGTKSGTCKLQIICGTSTTPVTLRDNIGSGC